MQLSDFLTYVRRDFKRTDKNTEITDAYNKMVVWIASVMPHGNYKYQSYVTTVSAQEDYQLPTTEMHLIHPIRLLLGTSSSDTGYQLDHITKQEYDLREPNPNRTSPQTARPTAYTIFSRQILLKPIPDSSSYLIEINWAVIPTDQSADSDTTELPTIYDEVLKWGTLERLYAGLGLTDEAQYWASLYRDQDHNPTGYLKRLLDAERDREMPIIGQVKFNSL